MVANNSNGWWNDTIAVSDHTNKIATIPSGSWLHEVNIQGYANLPTSAVTLTSGGLPVYNLSAGVQYGAAGYSVGHITNGAGGTNNWVVFSEGLPPVTTTTNNNGTSPTNVMQHVGFAYRVRWRGLLYISVSTDIYWVVGVDTAFTPVPTFASDYSWWVAYST